MLKPIIDFLAASKKDAATLFFIEKSGVGEYKSRSAKITANIGEEFIKKATKQVKAIAKAKPRYQKHNELPGSDQKCVNHLDGSEVPNFSKIIQSIHGKLEAVTEKDLKKVWGYIVKIDAGDGKSSLVLFKKYTPKKLLEKNKILAVFDEQGFNLLSEKAIAIESNFDAAIVMSEDPKKRTKLFVLNPSQFESLFSYIEAYEKAIDLKKESLSKMGILTDTDALIGYCNQNSRMVRKLARALESGEYTKITNPIAKKMAKEYGLSLEFDSSGRIKVDEKNMWQILGLLSDDYLKSEATDNKYESHAKVKK